MVAYYAHSRNSAGIRQDLVDHVRNVAALTESFAAQFGAGELGRFVAQWHDIGKLDPRFQQYLLDCEANPQGHARGPDHKAAGSVLALQHAPPLAMLVQGHHGGLRSKTGVQAWIAEHAKLPEVGDAIRLAPTVIPGLAPQARLVWPAHLTGPTAAEFFLRMLFSALVDADCLDTEAHFNPEQAARRGAAITLADLWERFERDQDRLLAGASGAVGLVRRTIYQACLEAASHEPGLFRLTVPTGGGKTRSGMAFALRHALRHGMQRIIVVVPFITITEQTASVYRDIFEAGAAAGDRPVVLEHHSGVNEAADDDDDFHERSVWRRLTAENWDAPIVVTTSVQLFQSIFACRTRGVRKLHRLARSVVVLDEAQSLPPTLLTPILDGLQDLCRHYGATVVLSTATQPAFDTIPAFADLPAREIVPEPERHFAALRRVDYEWRTAESLQWAEAAALLRAEPAGLAVLNTRKDALALLDALGDPDALHLSTLLCGAHRRRVIAEVKRRLAAGESCRLVATQVVEAGVDLDFPLVLRALGPLDGIIQAAGRCNREGLRERGRVIVFRPSEGGMPGGSYRTGVGVTGALLGAGHLDPDDPATARRYFAQLFARVDLDAQGIQGWRAGLDYPEVARRFRMIDDDTFSVVVTGYGTEEERMEVRALLEALRAGGSRGRWLLRRLQPYVVAVRRREVARYEREGWIAPIIEGLGEWHGGYDRVRGLTTDDPTPDVWVV